MEEQHAKSENILIYFCYLFFLFVTQTKRELGYNDL